MHPRKLTQISSTTLLRMGFVFAALAWFTQLATGWFLPPLLMLIGFAFAVASSVLAIADRRTGRR